MGNYLLDAGVFLLDTVVSLYILAVLLRFLLQLARADFFNLMAQFLVKVTTPTLKPLRRFIPGLWGIDLAAVALLLLLEGLLVFLVGPGSHPMLQLGLVFGQPPRVAGLIVLTVAELLKTKERQPALDRETLAQSITDGHVIVHYQPKVPFRPKVSGYGVEALCRIQHPELGLIFPDNFNFPI